MNFAVNENRRSGYDVPDIEVPLDADGNVDEHGTVLRRNCAFEATMKIVNMDPWLLQDHDSGCKYRMAKPEAQKMFAAARVDRLVVCGDWTFCRCDSRVGLRFLRDLDRGSPERIVVDAATGLVETEREGSVEVAIVSHDVDGYPVDRLFQTDDGLAVAERVQALHFPSSVRRAHEVANSIHPLERDFHDLASEWSDGRLHLGAEVVFLVRAKDEADDFSPYEGRYRVLANRGFIPEDD